MAVPSLNLAYHLTHVALDLGCTRSIGSRSAIKRCQKHACYCGITSEFCSCSKSSVFANSETETCLESCIIHFPTTPACSTTVDVLETGDVPILFSFPQMRNLGTTIELDPHGDKITCLALACFLLQLSIPHWDIFLDLTSLTYQPTTKSTDRLGPKRHVTFAMSERKPSISGSCSRHA